MVQLCKEAVTEEFAVPQEVFPQQGIHHCKVGRENIF